MPGIPIFLGKGIGVHWATQGADAKDVEEVGLFPGCDKYKQSQGVLTSYNKPMVTTVGSFVLDRDRI